MWSRDYVWGIMQEVKERGKNKALVGQILVVYFESKYVMDSEYGFHKAFSYPLLLIIIHFPLF